MRVLVTGGGGFIGRHACQALAARGHEPVVLDRYRDAPLGGYPLLLGDIRDPTAVTEAAAHVDAVIHLAGVLGTQETIANPRPAAETNISGLLNVAEACAQYRVPLVNIAVGNWFEDNTYSVTKHAAERLCAMYARHRGLAAVSVRAFNAYGPGQAAPRPWGTSAVRKIIPSFTCRALAGLPVQVYGDGQQIMDMIYVSDVAVILTLAAERLAGGSLPPGTLLEAGTGRATTVMDIADAVLAETARQGRPGGTVEKLPMRPGETPGVTVLADPSGLSAVGADPAELVPLAVGLAATVTWYREVIPW